MMRSPGHLAAIVHVALLCGCGEKAAGPPPAAGSAGGAAAANPQALHAQAAELEKAGLYVEAGHLLLGGIGSFPAAERGALELKIASLYHRGNLDDLALKHAALAIRAGVSDSEALYILGDAQRSLFHPDARATLEKLLAEEPKHAGGQLAYARLLYRVAEPAASLPVFEKFFSLVTPAHPQFEVATVERARALRAAGRHQQAADEFAMLLEHDPFDAKVYSELASSLYRLHRREEAELIEQIYKAISENAFDEHIEVRLREQGATAFALGQQGVNRTRQRRYLEAFDAYRRAIVADPRDPRLRIFIADLLIRFHRQREALAQIEEGLRMAPRPTSGLLWSRGLAHAAQQDFKAALAAFQAAAAARAEEGDLGGEERGQAPLFALSLALARSAIETGDLALADAAVEQAIVASPQSWEPQYWRGRVQLGHGDAAGALARFEDAGKRGGESLIDLSYHRALALARAGRTAEALTQLEQVLTRQSSFAPAYEAYLKEGAGTPQAAAVAARLAQLEELKAEVKKLEAAVDCKPLAECGSEYHALGRLALQLKDPGGFDDLFLAADLVPGNADTCQLLLSGMKRPQDTFVRLHYLRRLLAIEPNSDLAMVALADVYTRLYVRPAEALALASRAHGLRSGASTFRVLGLAEALSGDNARGLSTLREGLKAFPSDDGLKRALERLETQVGRAGG